MSCFINSEILFSNSLLEKCICVMIVMLGSKLREIFSKWKSEGISLQAGVCVFSSRLYEVKLFA